MIRHIVMFKFKDETTQQEKETLAGQLRELIDTTDGLMLENEVAFDELGLHNSYDMVLNSVFENLDTLNAYATHPNHVKVLDGVKTICSSTVKIDYLTA